jgi:glycine cleavage system H protein
MSEINPKLQYTKDHEWVRRGPQPKTVTMGISDFAQAALGDVTYVQLPELGRVVKKGDVIGSVESVKAVSDIYAPLSGKITKINEELNADPAPINQDPFGAAWLAEIEMSDESELSKLLDAQAYSAIAK